MYKYILIFLFFLSNGLSSQIKLEGKLRIPKDTIFLNESVIVRYFCTQKPNDGFAHYPSTVNRTSDTYTYITCGDWGAGAGSSLNYLGCAAFKFTSPGKNKIPKIYLKCNGYDTIFSSNDIEVYVKDKIVSERYLTKINNPDVFYRDSLDSITSHINELKLDSLLEHKCKTQNFFLETRQTVYNFNGFKDTVIIEYFTNYLKFTCIGGLMKYSTHVKGGVQSNHINIKGKTKEFVSPKCDKKNFSSETEFDLDLHYIYYAQKHKIINVFAGQQEEVSDIKAEGSIKFKLVFNKKGIYNFSPAYIENYEKTIESVPVKVIIN